METFITNLPYLGVALVLLASGFGLPLPEDVPLLMGGYLCGDGQAHLPTMLVVTFVSVVGADMIMFILGRHYGHHVPKLPLVKHYLSANHLARAEAAFHKHGGKTLFLARFLPGLRGPAFFTAGSFRIPFWKFIVFDGSAALISVPTIVLIGWYFHDSIDEAKKWVGGAEMAILVVVAVAIVTVVIVKVVRNRRRRALLPVPRTTAPVKDV